MTILRLFLPLVLLGGPFARAEGFFDEYPYEFYSDGSTLTITSYHGSDPDPEIPDHVEDPETGEWLPVTQIASFSSNPSLQNLTLPEGIESINMFAFSDCLNLENVFIPETTWDIGDGAFSHCPSLRGFLVSEDNASYRADDGVLFDYDQDELICYPAGKSLTRYAIPDGVSHMRAYAFSSAAQLTTLDIPATVTSIGDSAFEDCAGFTTFPIPDHVISLGSSVFDDCAKLAEITVASTHPTFSSSAGVLFDKDHKTLLSYPPGNMASSYTIPGTVTNIGRGAFNGCSHLSSVTIPNGVTSIQGSAFNRCTGLSSIVIPDSVTSLGMLAFQNCRSLTSVTLSANLTKLEFGTFYRCVALPAITIPAKITQLDKYALGWCDNLTKIEFLGKAPSADPDAFWRSEATVYYHAGQTGFTPPIWQGLPTVEIGNGGDPLADWRRQYFGTTENSGPAADDFDYDGDGMRNIDEYTAGTDPTKSGDRFQIISNTRVGPDQILTIPGKAGRVYSLQRSTDLGATNPWVSLGSPQGPLPADATLLLSDPSPPAVRAFYRVLVSKP